MRNIMILEFLISFPFLLIEIKDIPWIFLVTALSLIYDPNFCRVTLKRNLFVLPFVFLPSWRTALLPYPPLRAKANKGVYHIHRPAYGREGDSLNSP